MHLAHAPIPAALTLRALTTATVLAVLFAAIPLGTAHAFGIHEAENNADLFPNNPDDWVAPGDVSLGLNAASGHFTCQGFGCQDFFDSFRMTVPDGLEITFTEFFVPRGQEPGNFDPGVPEQFFIYPGATTVQPTILNVDWKSPNLIGITVFPEPHAGVPFTSSTVLGPGTYDVVVADCCPPDAIAGGGSWAVRFTATVVPEPATLLLLLSGVVAVGWRRRS